MHREEMIARAADLLTRSQAEAWEVFALESEQVSVGVRGEEVDKFQQSTGRGLALRVIREGRLGFAWLQGPAQAEDVAAAVEQALAAAAASDLEAAGGLAEPETLPPEPEVFDPELAGEPVEELRRRAAAMVEAARAADPRVVHVHPAEVTRSVSRIRLVNSQGLDLERRGTAISAWCNAVAAADGGQEMAWDSDSRRFAADLDPRAVGRRAGRQAAELLGAEPVPDGRYHLLLEPQVAVEFLELLSASLQGDNLVKGRSLLAGREGQQIASSLVTIIDDPLLPRGLGSAAFDGEGTPTRTKTLVEAGVLRGFVFDRLWGARAGRASTGNASRGGVQAPPGVGFANLYLQPGDSSPQELVAGLERAVVITEVMGAHTADPVSGEFSLGAVGRLVERGQVVRPVKSIAVAGQVLELLSAVEAVGDDLRFFGRSGSPSLLVAGVSLSGASGG
jgi:PmbA protein